MNLNDSSSVSIISGTGTPMCFSGIINHHKAEASCSGVVVVKQRLALWNICTQTKCLRVHIKKNDKHCGLHSGGDWQPYRISIRKFLPKYSCMSDEGHTAKERLAEVLATDRPFLVNCSGPSFMIV